MKKALAFSCGIAAAGLGAVAFSPAPVAVRTPLDDVSLAASETTDDRRPNEMAAIRTAHGAPLTAAPAKLAAADHPNGQAGLANRRGRTFFDDWDGPGDDDDWDGPGDDDDRPGTDDDWGGADDRG